MTSSANPSLSLSERALAARRGAALPVSGDEAPWLTGLNPEQKQAVETLDGPLLVLAGAGTGKTRVLTCRIAHILSEKRAFPSQILSVTFTNKAAREMKERVHAMIGDTMEGMGWLGTFHAIGTKILRRHAELVGLKPSFTILNTDDQIRLLKQLIQAAHIDDKKWPARQLAFLIDSWKNKGLTPDKVSSADDYFAGGQGVALYKAYQERLSILNAVDFGDLLLLPIRLFMDHPDVLADYHRRFRYILVDEYQDTNVAQYLWLRLLAQGSHNVCCVGDDDQSIYGWRGAEVDNILRFEKDFPGAKVIRLERNYRSTPDILGAASHLISHNEGRLGKTLFPDNKALPDADKVKVASSWDSQEEARAIGDEIEAIQAKGHALNDMAILVRASYQMREFEDRFITMGLNYRVIGGPRFYERAEIRDALAYLRLIRQQGDDLAFERIVNTPRRGLGDATLQIVHNYARAHQMPLFFAAQELVQSDELSSRARNSLSQFLQDILRWQDASQAMAHTDLAELVLDESGYTAMWQKDKSPDAQGRLDNLKELVRAMQEFDTLAGFLEHIALVMDVETQDTLDAISVMTLHAAKGLEFDTVFLPGWEEGLFPSQRTLDEQGKAGLEEERRLAYVGITRARERCYIWFASNRRIHGLWQSSLPSRFLDELPEAHVEVMEGGSVARSQGFGPAGSGFGRLDEPVFDHSSYQTPGWKRAQRTRTAGDATRSRSPLTLEGELLASSERQSSYQKGQRIFHQKFGYGHIAALEGNKLTIDFDKAGRKKVLESFVKKA
jgi:DNA helicase-2/ATP-dependent DNA helicase PcrA